MRSIDKDEVFLEHYYKCYNNLRIFIVAAIQAAENLGFQEEDNRNRIVVAEKNEKKFIAKEEKFTELTTKTDIYEEEIECDLNDTNVATLQEEARQAIATLVQARQETWYLLIQDILDGNTDSTKISKEEAELLAHQFGARDKITVPGLLSEIKKNMIAMMRKANEGVICQNDNEQEKERALTFKRWLRWNKDKIKHEIDFLSYVDTHFFEPGDIKNEFATSIKPLIDDIGHRIAVPTNPPKYNEVQQIMGILSRRGVFKSSFVSQSNYDQNKKLVETAIVGLSILIDNIVTEEDFSWYIFIQKDLLEWKKRFIDQRSIIQNTYELKSTLAALEKSFTELEAALVKDKKLKQNINEHFDTESAHRLAEEMMTQFRSLKNHLKALREKLDENTIVRFLKNIFSAIRNWRETGKVALKWCKANPWTTFGISVMVVAFIGLTAFAPYASLPLVLAFGVTAATADAIATTGIILGAVALGAVVASSTAGAGSLIRLEQRNKMSQLERDVEDAEERANEAERRASAAEAAYYRRKKLEGYASQREDIAAEKNALMARMEALNAADSVLAARANLDRARAQEMERAALPQNPTNQEITRVNLQTEEDNLDNIIDSLGATTTQTTLKQVQLATQREQIVSDINKQREETRQTMLRKSEISNLQDHIKPTAQSNIPNIAISTQNLRHTSMFEEQNEAAPDTDTVFNQILLSDATTLSKK
ncbi:MAG: hypothetical protein CK424_02865 [Legionella sp.]|nr:MAG: hypothetical protein CK424_02865 [Legionella sp.]